jgi:hypothetical protein
MEALVWVSSVPSQCRTQRGAKEALINAVKSGTVEGFREGVLAALDSRPILIGMILGEGGVEEQDEATARKMDAQEARRQVLKGYGGLVSSMKKRACVKCSKWEEEDKKFMQCPCQSVSYCQKSCQANDWKEHKKVCSYHADKKKPKAK